MSLTSWDFGFTLYFSPLFSFQIFSFNLSKLYFPPNLKIWHFFLPKSVVWHFQSFFLSSHLISCCYPHLFSLSSHSSLPMSHILSMNAGRINPVGNTMSASHDRCTKACSTDKRQLWWALSGIPQKHWGETFANPSPGSRPPGPRTGSYLEKPMEKSGETRKSPSPPGTPLEKLSPEPNSLALYLKGWA